MKNKDRHDEVLEAIKQTKYGSVEITIHNSQIVQIERKEKIRFDGRNSDQDTR